MALKGTPIKEAERIGKAAGASRVVVLTLDDDGTYAWTTWGKDKRTCEALREWGDHCAEPTLMEMFERTS